MAAILFIIFSTFSTFSKNCLRKCVQIFPSRAIILQSVRKVLYIFMVQLIIHINSYNVRSYSLRVAFTLVLCHSVRTNPTTYLFILWSQFRSNAEGAGNSTKRVVLITIAIRIFLFGFTQTSLVEHNMLVCLGIFSRNVFLIINILLTRYFSIEIRTINK